MTQDRYRALRGVSDQVTMDVLIGGRRQETRSHLSELLDLPTRPGDAVNRLGSGGRTRIRTWDPLLVRQVL